MYFIAYVFILLHMLCIFPLLTSSFLTSVQGCAVMARKRNSCSTNVFARNTYRKAKEAVLTEGFCWFNKTNRRTAFYLLSKCKIFSWLLRGREERRWREKKDGGELSGAPIEVPRVVSTFSIYYVRGKSVGRFRKSFSFCQKPDSLHLSPCITLFLSL